MSIHAFESTPHGTRPVDFPDPGKDFCNLCGDEYFTANLYDSYRAGMGNLKLCRACAPDCQMSNCLDVAMAGSDFCAHHEAQVEAEYQQAQAKEIA